MFGRARRPEGPTGVGRPPAGTGLPAYKRLNVVIDEESPTYAPPTCARLPPADLVAVGDE
jgi:hypothetical protein